SPIRVRAGIEKRRYLDLLVEDTGWFEIEFANGVRGRFEATWAAEKRKNRAKLQCRDGCLEIENDRLLLRRPGAVGAASEEVFAESLAGGGYRPSWTAGIVREFEKEIGTPEARGQTLGEALACLSVLEAAYAS